MNYRGSRARTGDDGIVTPDVDIPNRVIAGKTFGGAAWDIQLVGSGRHIDRGARIYVGERDCAAQATVIRRSSTCRSGGGIVRSIDIYRSKRQGEIHRLDCAGSGRGRRYPDAKIASLSAGHAPT